MQIILALIQNKKRPNTQSFYNRFRGKPGITNKKTKTSLVFLKYSTILYILIVIVRFVLELLVVILVVAVVVLSLL